MKDIKNYIQEKQLTLDYNVNPNLSGKDLNDRVSNFNSFMQQIKREEPKAFSVFLYGLGNSKDLHADIGKDKEGWKVTSYSFFDEHSKKQIGKTLDPKISGDVKSIIKELQKILIDKTI